MKDWFQPCVVALMLLSDIISISAAEVNVRLVAADRQDRPLVSDLVDFRHSPDGGLIAVQWISGVQADGKPLFAVQSDDASTPRLPKLDKQPATSDLDDLLKEINKNTKPSLKARAVDVVDKQYRDAKLFDGRKIGPARSRRSESTVAVSNSMVASPGDVRITTRSKQIDVPCYPLTITAIDQDGRRTAFTPRLSYEGRDLLADCLFEHSPDVPQGDESKAAQGAAQGQLGRLSATRGGKRSFRRLTVYLPATGKQESFRLQGHEFKLDTKGATLTRSTSEENKSAETSLSNRTSIRKISPFHLELAIPELLVRETKPIIVDLTNDWKIEQPLIEFSSDRLGAVEFSSPRYEKQILRPELPRSKEEGHLHIIAIADSEKPDSPVVRVVATPRAKGTQLSEIRIHMTQCDARGAGVLPKSFIAKLNPRHDLLRLQQHGTNGAQKPHASLDLAFNRIEADTWSAATTGIEPGFYGLQLDVKPSSSRPIPIVVVSAKTAGSASLLTWHNRCDYLRGEFVHLCILVRGAANVNELDGSIMLRHESGETHILSDLMLSCPAGQSRSWFVPIDTGKLRLGRYTVSMSQRQLLSYATAFTVHPATPRSNFALYSWFSNSFSGPMKAGDKTLVNILLSQKPTAPLTPEELQRYTRQPVFPAELRDTFSNDPFYPAPETTIGYDPDTEREIAVAMRLGMRYCPDYGWGMNSQEGAWNPKHTLPEELDRIRRLCSQVTQRHRDFGNFGGLHFNWYPRLNGNWENHPVTDGNAIPRREKLQQEVQQVFAETDADRKSPDGGLRRSVRAHKHRVGAFARAYDAWTERSRELEAGTNTNPNPKRGTAPESDSLAQQTNEERQPGLTGPPVYTSFPPISWFQQRNYYPSVFHSTLPVAAVHAYTDYGFSPFQPLWGVDHWAAGVGDKPVWVTTMSNGQDIMLGHALLLAGRGADGIDIKGQDDKAAGVISDFLSGYGPLFRTLQPHSEVAIITSLRQQFSTKELIGQWMGYTGGKYFDLYTKLWYAGRPPAMLSEEDVSMETLRQYKAVFLLGQQVSLPDTAMKALKSYAENGGHVFKDSATSDNFPGQEFQLTPTPNDGSRPAWSPEKYRQTRDQFFVGTQAGYEAIADSLDKLMSNLSPPRVDTPTRNVLLASLEKKLGRSANSSIRESDKLAIRPTVESVVFAVNDTHPWPGIQHPWNFWSATIMATEAKLRFDKPYVLYDLLEGGREIRLDRKQGNRYELPVSFDRCAGRVYLAVSSPIRAVRLKTIAESTGGAVPVEVDILDDRKRTFADPLPCEITLTNDRGQVVQTLNRALGGSRRVMLTIPHAASEGKWQVRVRELASGRCATATVLKKKHEIEPVNPTRVLLVQPSEVEEFFNVSLKSETPLLILLDQRQSSESVKQLAELLAKKLSQRGLRTEVKTITADDIVEVPLRWRPTARDQQYVAEAKAGKRVLAAGSLNTRHFRNTDGSSGSLDVLHPESGWSEPGARHRIYQHVILLGDTRRNRFLDDLHATVGMQANGDFAAPGSALVQVVYDAFTPRHDCLSIQASDLEGLRRGIEAVSDTQPTRQRGTVVEKSSLALRVGIVGDEIVPPANPIRDVFGAAVHPIAFTQDGGLLASAGTQAANYFRFDADGKLQKKWLGKYGLELSAQGAWIQQWWGAPGFVDTIVRADEDLRLKWLMPSPRYSRSFAGWRHPGRRTVVDSASGDLFVSGHHQITRVVPDGKVAWRYDDLSTSTNVDDFRFSRDMMLYGLSPDGRFLLAAAFGVEPYANIVNRFVRPEVLLFEAATGKVVWTKRDILIDHSACGFVGQDRIVVADATPGKKRVILLNLDGKEIWSQSRRQGVSQAEMTPDGKWLIARPEAPRGANFQTLGPPKGLAAIEIADRGRSVTFPLSAPIHAWRVLKSNGRILASTTDGRLRCFRPDASLLWEQRFNGPVQLLVSDDGAQIVLGTQNGLLMWLNGEGEKIRELDLMPHNIVQDIDKYVADYTATPSDIPIADPRPALPPRIDVRCGKVVGFSKNLIGDAPASRQLARAPLKTTASWQLPNAKSGSYVLSFLQRTGSSRSADSDEKLNVEISAGSDVIYTTSLAVSSSDEERNVAWRLSKPAAITVSVRYTGKNDGVAVRDPRLLTIRFPSRNLLAQKLLDAPEVSFDTKTGDLETLLGDDQKLTPPSVRFFLPNDVNLAARSRGAPPFRQVIPFTTPFDGRHSGQKTSWLARPVTASTHAQLQLTFKTPTKLAALAIYEDPAAPYTETYALFCRNAESKQWFKAGHVINNQSPFNLFTFPQRKVDAVTYLWLKSGDQHARIAEMEGYRQSELGLLERK